MADINVIVVTGVSTKDATLRRRSSGIAKAEFSLEVERPFARASGEPVSDLFLVDVYGPLAERCADVVTRGTRLLVVGTLNKESFVTRHGRREHMTVIKAKHFRVVDLDLRDMEDVDLEEVRRDHWNRAVVDAYLVELADILQAGETRDSEQ